MRFSEKWLREWVDPPIDRDALISQLTMLGLEVDAAEPAAAEFSGVVVGHVLGTTRHPDSDKLNICEVAAGADETFQVVCGAPNVVPGMCVPFAQIGARLPGGLEIKLAQLRGVESQGMLCSERELGLSEDGAGLMALAADAPAGVDLHEYLQLDDMIVEIDLTPNRGDCLSIRGVAREISARNRASLHPPEIVPAEITSQRRFDVRISDESGQTRYAGRVIEGIDTAARSPQWLIEKLRRSGIRSISPVVDVTNYVMLEFGQPMHGFDLDQLNGYIEVRNASPDESLTLLDGTELSLQTDTLVIADESGAVAMAGIMGGLNSGVSDATRDIFLESAFFAPEWITGRPRRYGLATDSGHRFERGVDPALQEQALERATGLLLEIVGGRAGPVVLATGAQARARVAPIRLRPSRIQRVLGIAMGGGEVADILKRLGMTVTEDRGDWLVQPPTYRFDIAIEADLIEELARIRGYDHLPRTRPQHRPQIQPRPEQSRDETALRRILVERGYQEAVTYSFVDPMLQQLLDPDCPPLALANPLSADLAVMRTSLWPGLVKTLSYNLNRQQNRIRLFELGKRFRGQGDELQQVDCIAGVLFGPIDEEQWSETARPVDFFDAKGDLEALLPIATASTGFGFQRSTHKALHPGQGADILFDGRTIGQVGALHPSVAHSLDLPNGVFVFELELAPLLSRALPKFESLSKFPAIRRDLALIVDENLPAQSLLDTVKSTAPDFLRDVFVFDVYQGKGVIPGRKSVALGLILQDLSRTLVDDEVEDSVARILARLKADLGATLRE